MLNLSRRNMLAGAAFAAALGLDKRLMLIGPAYAQKTPDPAKGFYKYNVGSIEVTALYDGVWEKPHDPAFIKNASVEETKEALAKAGLTTEFVSIPLTVVRGSGSQLLAGLQPTCRGPGSTRRRSAPS